MIFSLVKNDKNDINFIDDDDINDFDTLNNGRNIKMM